jgi:hypothetical protein
MDVRIRPEGLGHCQETRINKRHLAVALLLSAGVFLAGTSGLQSAVSTGEITASVSAIAHADHQIAIGQVGPGEEGISISAQLAEDSMESLNAVQWRIWRAGGDIVFKGKAQEATARVLPGEYLVEAKYGAATFEVAFNVGEGNHVSVNLILNIGAVRILPIVPGAEDAAIKAVSKVYALAGLDRGKLVAQSRLPGEVLELAAGTYRIESRFENGNAMAVSDVQVRAGMMSAVEFHHKAGIARLASSDQISGPISWKINSLSGEVVSLSEVGQHDIVLQPGHYTAAANFNGNQFDTEFDLVVGETQTITLGN